MLKKLLSLTLVCLSFASFSVTKKDTIVKFDFAPDEADSTIANRIAKLNENIDMKIPFNATIRGFIDHFTIRDRNYTRKMIYRSQAYFPIIEYYLKKHNMPLSLKYLTIVESGISCKAESWVGAIGMWQFMPATGDMYKLKYNEHFDDKMDYHKATEAACKFLKYLYSLYGDWELALAAYNCGPGNVNKAIRRSGKHTFWGVYNYLPQETRGYVPQFQAVQYTMNYLEEHNLYYHSREYIPETSEFTTNTNISLDYLSKELGICPTELHKINPKYKTPIVPKNCTFRIPCHLTEEFLDKKDHIVLNTPTPEYFSHEIPKVEPKSAPAKRGTTPKSTSTQSKTTVATTTTSESTNNATLTEKHIVKKGETLSSIALKNNITVNTLKQYNPKLYKNNIIVPGQSLYVSKSTNNIENNNAVASTNTPIVEKEKSIEMPKQNKTVVTQKSTPVAEKTTTTNAKYIVKSGDIPANIAKKHNITLQQLQEWNPAIGNKMTIRVGQSLVVAKPSETKSTNNNIASSNNNKNTSPTNTASKPTSYTVKSGDNLSTIANKNNITVEQLKKYNPNLKSTLMPGDKVSLVDPNSQQTKENTNVASTEATPKTEPTIELKASNKNTTLPGYYIVKKGDTLWNISEKYHVKVDTLKRVNKLKTNDVRVGQKLKLS